MEGRKTSWGDSFNSIKVQLEHASDFAIPEFDSMFQFHKGTIRTSEANSAESKAACFNSIKVQLEL